MRRLLGCLRALLLAVAAVISIVLAVITTYGNYRGEVRSSASVALAVVVFFAVLLLWPTTSPPATSPSATDPSAPDQAREPAPTARPAVGRALIGISHLLRAGLTGYGVYYLTFDLDVAFQPLLAGLAAIAYGNALVGRWGQHLAGFPVDWGFLRGAALLRYLLRIAIGVAAAGYARVLSHYWWAVVDAVPLAVYRWLRAEDVAVWLAVLVTGLGVLLLLFVIATILTVVQRVAAQLLGPDNAVSAWLADHGAMTWIHAPDGTVFDGSPLVPFRFSSSFLKRPGPRMVEKCRPYERPLASPQELDRLVDRIADAALRLAPDRPYVRVTYRAVADHEEVGLAASDTSLGDWYDGLETPADRRTPTDEQPIADFPELAALRRLRESTYAAGRGAAYTLHVTVASPPDENHFGWRRWTSEWTDGGPPRPAWRQAPRPRQYVADLRRFPAARRMVPLWLREELRWRWLLPLRVLSQPPPAG
jgi:hypothetical protein